MGYTHYWRQTRPFTDGEWQMFAAVSRTLLARSGVELGDGYGQGKPVITDDEVSFNGVGAGEHEGCLIERDPASEADDYRAELFRERGYWFQFCKTACKPYDGPVVALLIAAAHICDGFGWDSDGDREDHAAGERLAGLVEIPYTMGAARVECEA